MKKFYTVLLIFALSAGLLLTAAACGHKEEEPPIAEIQPEPEPVPQIPVDDPQLPGAFLVMIDNMEDARPQSGLDKADVVFEIEAEGGITRYMALFYNNGADKIGPCRSARYILPNWPKAWMLSTPTWEDPQTAILPFVSLSSRILTESGPRLSNFGVPRTAKRLITAIPAQIF